jgi:uncharacterized protein YdeI (YjbR/CyaY-like superfamily)
MANGRFARGEARLPKDVNEALGANLRRVFAAMAPSHRREWLEFVSAARRPETRGRRVEKLVRAMKERQSRAEAAG